MENSEAIQKQMEAIEKQKEMLEKQRQELMVAEGKAYYCRTSRCKSFVDKEKISPTALEHGLCSNCYNRKWNEEARQTLMKKLKFARIVDIQLNGPYDIETITVYRNGMLYELKAEYDRDLDDDASIVIDSEERDNGQLEIEEEELKPWMKQRQEKPLLEKDS